jgi:putative transcriptional regulator
MTPIFSDLMRGLDEVEAFLAVQTAGTSERNVDVKSIRKRLNMTQARFSDAFGFSLDAVKHWEGAAPLRLPPVPSSPSSQKIRRQL